MNKKLLKKGDIVRCKSPSGELIEGNTYTVAEDQKERSKEWVDIEDQGEWYSFRFEKVGSNYKDTLGIWS